MDLTDPRPCPPRHLYYTVNPENHPVLHWALNTEDDIAAYNVYRAIITHEGQPTDDDYVVIATTNHPTNTYTDPDVYVYLPAYNCKVYYYVSAFDAAQNESLGSNEIKLAGVYHPGSLEGCEGVLGAASPAEILLSASPNPFNPTTRFSFTLPEAARVSLKVFNLQGSLVATVVDGMRDAGSHEVTFDAANLTSGIYLYRLTAGSFNTAGKMVLVK